MYFLVICLFLFHSDIQIDSISFEDISFSTLGFYSSPDKIKSVLGEPLRIEEPKYECGFLSSDEQQKTFISLIYPHVKFTGAQNGLYILEEIRFDDPNVKLRFGETVMSGASHKSEIMNMFGLSGDLKSLDRFLVRSDSGDDGLMVLFKNERLVEIHY